MKKDNISDIINKSGNPFQIEVFNFLKSKGWSAEMSPYYTDWVTGASREIDVVARKESSVSGGFAGEELRGEVKIRLLVDCKKINEDFVFWFVPRTEEYTMHGIHAAKSNYILRKEDVSRLITPSDIGHHYLKEDDIVMLWQAGKDSSGDKRDAVFKGVNQCLHSLIYFNEYSSERGYVDYPLIVVESFSRFYKASESPPNSYAKMSGNFQILRNYSYTDKDGKSKSRYFLIDVVEFGSLDDFLTHLQNNDMRIFERSISDQLNEVSFNRQRNRADNYI